MVTRVPTAWTWRIQPTYEELKRVCLRLSFKSIHGIQPTYEELKRCRGDRVPGVVAGIQPTYEELKPNKLLVCVLE